MIGAIHVYSILNPGPASVNAEGRRVGTYASVTVEGRVDELTSRDVEIAAAVGMRHDITCSAPLDTDVSDRSLVIVTEPERLAGTYEVDTLRVTRQKLRVLASRTTIRGT